MVVTPNINNERIYIMHDYLTKMEAKFLQDEAKPKNKYKAYELHPYVFDNSDNLDKSFLTVEIKGAKKFEMSNSAVTDSCPVCGARNMLEPYYLKGNFINGDNLFLAKCQRCDVDVAYNSRMSFDRVRSVIWANRDNIQISETSKKKKHSHTIGCKAD